MPLQFRGDVNNNPMAIRNLYPNAPGMTTGQAGKPTVAATPADPSGSSSLTEQALRIGILGEPLKWWILLTITTFALWWLATRFRGNTAAANIKFSLFNIFAILAVSTLSQSLAKVFFTRFPIPGISTVVLAA